MTPYLICKFEKQTLTNLVKECFGSDFPDIFNKKQTDYIYNYLSDINCNSVLLEFEYLDKDYLDDYIRYYSKSYNNRGAKSARLHFFSNEINHTRFEEILRSNVNTIELQENYLGFMVVKPLQKTFIGRTCLKRYPDTDKSRKVILSRNYNVDLFGVKLEVNSIAFQEQDTVLSACAATAIWSSLNAIQSKSVRDIPSCSEITTNAINHIAKSNNSFPKKELSNKQILRAIDFEELKHHSESVRKLSIQKFIDIVKLHINSKVPMILGGQIYSIDEDGNLEYKGGHAVSIIGYKLTLEDNRTSAIYIHDDRLGPFVKATFETIENKYTNKSSHSISEWGMVVQKKDSSGQWLNAHEIIIPDSLIILTNKKVRLPYNFMMATSDLIISEYKNHLSILNVADEKRFSDIRFEIALKEISEVRQKCISIDYIEEELSTEDLNSAQENKVSFLTKNYSRFQWVSQFYLEDVEVFSYLIDATDIPQGDAVTGIFIDNYKKSKVILTYFNTLANSYTPQQNAISDANSNFYISFIKKLKENKGNLFSYLDNSYGKPRAPKYLKSNEISNGSLAQNPTLKIYYGTIDKTLTELYPNLIRDDENSYLLWAISYDGALLIGEEKKGIGHPSLTGFKPARIAGELKRVTGGWSLSSKSGRYSGDYANASKLVNNVIIKIKTIFKDDKKDFFKH